jgi:epoxyqueuosine reductase
MLNNYDYYINGKGGGNMSITSDIKEYGLYLGYCAVGVTSADDFDSYIEEVGKRANYEFLPFIPFNTIAGSYPKKAMPSAKSIVVLLLNYRQKAIPENLDSMIGNLYLSRCYTPPENSPNGARLRMMIEYLEVLGCEVNQDIHVPARYAAARAGVADIGKNTFAYADEVGSYVIIYTLVIDKELEYDTPTLVNKCPEGCKNCKEACPTQAIIAPFTINPMLCIGMNNWGVMDIPAALRSKIGSRIHGCDICQKVCPRNKAATEAKLPKDQFLEKIAPDITLTNILNMDEAYYEKRIRPILYNYIADLKVFRRNAAIAMGNSGDESYLPHLEQALLHRDETTREYAAWALGAIGGTKAEQILNACLKTENDEKVKNEIISSLNRLAT